ncbi:hypothetical protein I7X12_09600 [Halosimplex litoreum]|uniref:Uncharacterized protein n=1 Tax=Halosimplex litoreum TaxID=1198301 RepID=A0A7U3WB36_9EURY|nr:hypothetical protein [Halosimplex litoreum]QPV64831.1 hypothetical protein I7X12_09600 [Halosimplex litoreum]
MTPNRSTVDRGDSSERGLSYSRSLRAFVAVLVVLSAASALASAGAYGGAAVDPEPTATPNHTSQPRDANVTVVLSPSASVVTTHAWYIARSEAEARQYDEGTANLTWFETDDRLHRAFADRDEALLEEFNDTTSSERTFESGSVVHVNMRFHWVFDPDPGSETPTSWSTDPFVGNGSLVLGPTVDRHLPNGTVVEVRVPAAEWTAERSTVDSYTDGNHGQTRVYGWTVGETDTEPRVVFNESVRETETAAAEDGAVGPAGGALLALLAVVLTVLTGRNYRD